MKRIVADETTKPIAVPIAVNSIVCRTIDPTTAPRCAPRAIRIPISRVRLDTVGGTTFAFYCPGKVQSKDTAAVVAALSRQIRRLPTTLRRSLTWDRGLEMARHKSFTVATNVKVYFCDPHSPWQRGTNENTNRLLRHYLPKRTGLSGYTQSQLDKIALRLNQRPRKTLGFQTPASKLRASVAPTS
jgi:IS30 family transposase